MKATAIVRALALCLLLAGCSRPPEPVPLSPAEIDIRAAEARACYNVKMRSAEDARRATRLTCRTLDEPSQRQSCESRANDEWARGADAARACLQQ